jgi:uncharacterized protein YbbC (DUF1343 family)/CubicO group peptidase (beta-lactamase class C family)
MDIKIGLVLVAVAAFGQPSEQLKQLADRVDPIVNEAVRTNLIPGAVLLVGHDAEIVYRKAYGFRSLVPKREVMTVDTIFDAASLTKVVATTPSLMRLFEVGKLRLDDPVTKYLPEFQGGKSDITIRLLMTHFSGLPPDIDLAPQSGYKVALEKCLTVKPVAPPGARFIYSDINFQLLGEIVQRLSGMSLADFARREFYGPLGMTDTGFLPAPGLRPRIAPTEIDPDTKLPLRGVVHDPRSRYSGGVAGHAGLFTTADDLGKYSQMMLNGGKFNGVQIFSPATVKKFTEPASPADQPILRGLGWDIDSSYSSNRGELYPIGSFGHTGFTGTSLWIDPTTRSYVILLTNVVHPLGIKSLSSLRSRVSTAVAATFELSVPNTVALTGYNETITGAGVHRVIARNATTMTGLDVMAEDGFSELKGKKIGLITNHTGLDSLGRRNVDLMLAAGVNVTALFSPEHGIAGAAQVSDVADSKDLTTGLPIFSLYQPSQRRLKAAQMAKYDAIVFDIQDIGARFYTYSCTLLYALEEAGKARKTFWILDRPNPITGTHIEGPMMQNDLESFIGCYDLPVRHGLTLGELATMANGERKWGADLHVQKMKNWQRGDWFDTTSLSWTNPSPNIRSLNAAVLYPGLALLEAANNLSVGRGTDAPFEQIGAPWIDGRFLAQTINARLIPGVRVYPTRFRPSSSNFAGLELQGIRFLITDRESFDSTRLGIELAVTLQKLYPGKIDFDKCRYLIGSQHVVNDLKTATDASVIWSRFQEETSGFAQRRRPFLLY